MAAVALNMKASLKNVATQLTGKSGLLLLPSYLLTACLIAVPVIIVAIRSLWVNGAWSIGNYVTFFAKPHYIATIETTLIVALLCSFFCVLLAVPVCAFVATRSRRTVMLFMGGVMLSLSVSGLIRTLSWQVLLSRSGPINALLLSSGVISSPMSMLFTRVAVVVAMVQIMLPYAIAMIYSGMKHVDFDLVFAVRSLGASPLKTLMTAYFPQIRRSLSSAALLVFVLSSGFIITPALLGGANDMMLGNVMLADLNLGTDDATAMAATAGVILSIALIVVTVTAHFIGGSSFNVRKR